MIKDRLKSEVLYLYIIQATNLFLPLISYPYITSVLGMEGLGKVSYCVAVYLMLNFVIDFGFNLTSARMITLEKASQNTIYSNTLIAKLAIYAIVMVMSFLFLGVSNVGLDFTILMTLSSVLTPAWFYHGIGRNSIVAVVGLIFRLASFLMLFVFVRNEDDLVIAIILQFLPSFFSGFVLTFIATKIYKVKFVFSTISFSYIKKLSIDGFNNFSGSFLTLGFTFFNPILIKYLLGDYWVGVYAISEKIAGVLKAMISPVVQANFSSVCILLSKGSVSDLRKRYIKIFCFFILIFSGAFFFTGFFGRWIIESYFKVNNPEEVINLLYYMYVSLFIVATSMILINLYIVPAGKSAILKVAYLIGLIFHFSYVFFLINWFGIYGMSISVIFTELIVFLCLTILLTLSRKVSKKNSKEINEL